MSAVLSPDGVYRYALWRDLGLLGNGTVAFVMLNPSTADADQDDPTIRRCIGFAEGWGFARLAVVNLYAFRATKPGDLWDADDPVGPQNDDWISELVADAVQVIAAWGGREGPITGRPERVLELIKAAGLTPQVLGMTDGGAPRHPLYVRGDQQRIPYLVGRAA